MCLSVIGPGGARNKELQKLIYRLTFSNFRQLDLQICNINKHSLLYEKVGAWYIGFKANTEWCKKQGNKG